MNKEQIDNIVLCAKAMELDFYLNSKNTIEHTVRVGNSSYCPYINDDQAFKLAKRFMLKLDIFSGTAEFPTEVHKFSLKCFSDISINYAIVECIAKYQSEINKNKI